MLNSDLVRKRHYAIKSFTIVILASIILLTILIFGAIESFHNKQFEILKVFLYSIVGILGMLLIYYYYLRKQGFGTYSQEPYRFAKPNLSYDELSKKMKGRAFVTELSDSCFVIQMEGNERTPCFFVDITQSPFCSIQALFQSLIEAAMEKSAIPKQATAPYKIFLSFVLFSSTKKSTPILNDAENELSKNASLSPHRLIVLVNSEIVSTQAFWGSTVFWEKQYLHSLNAILSYLGCPEITTKKQ